MKINCRWEISNVLNKFCNINALAGVWIRTETTCEDSKHAFLLSIISEM
jgi:hypothetical protein